MSRLNYKQLYYFWHVARSGSVTRAAEQLHLTPQTVSGEWLQQAGLALPILDPESAILIGLQRV